MAGVASEGGTSETACSLIRSQWIHRRVSVVQPPFSLLCAMRLFRGHVQMMSAVGWRGSQYLTNPGHGEKEINSNICSRPLSACHAMPQPVQPVLSTFLAMYRAKKSFPSSDHRASTDSVPVFVVSRRHRTSQYFFPITFRPSLIHIIKSHTVQGRAKKTLLSSVTHVPSGLMGCAAAALG